MRTSALEHETEDKDATRGSEPTRQAGGQPVTMLDGAPPAVLDPRMLLGLQAMAGNAAVAGLIEKSRTPEAPPATSAPAPQADAAESPPSGLTEAIAPEEATSSPPPLGDGKGGAVSPRAGESDDELAALDAAAEAPPAASQPHSDETHAPVAQDAQAELADMQTEAGEQPAEPTAGSAETGAAIEERASPATPDVSASDPTTALASVGSLPPAQLLRSLSGVSNAAERKAVDEHDGLVANPPQRARHPGAPSTVQTPASTRVSLAERPAASIPRAPEGADIAVRQPATPPSPQLNAAALVEQPHLAAGSNGQLTAADVGQVASAIARLPTRDAGLDAKPGALPHLALEGNADPGVVHQQRSHLTGALQQERAGGQQDAAQPMGEDEMFPTVPPETLRAAVTVIPGGGGAASAAASGEDDEAASIIAQQEKGAEIQSAVGGGLSALAAQRQEYTQRAAAERARTNAEMTQLEQANTEQQGGERAAAKREVQGLRGQWSDAQRDLVTGAQTEANAKTNEAVHAVAQERSAAQQQAVAHYERGQRDADHARLQGEQQAAAERQKAHNQTSGGLFGFLASAAQSLFDRAKQAVQSFFERARQLVHAAIERAQQLATSVMELARQNIVGLLRTAGTALTAIGDRVLVAFPALRDRFRRAILDRIAAAEAAVNKLAGVLKQAVLGALNLLGTALSAAIGLWQRGVQLAIDGVRGAVQGAIQFARGAIAAFGTFAGLVKDIAAGPVRWVANLASAARDGIRNHLWPDLKAAVQGWFNDKVDAVLGLGSAVWSLLRRGGITVAHVATFAWEAIKSMIPQTIIWVLIEKLVSLLVPAAAAVMLIIQALQAAWGSLGRIIQAFDAFVTFLKGVRWGNAGSLFGKALAAGAVAVIEFVSQFVLQRLMGAAGAVAGKLRALAKRIGSQLASVGRGVVRGAKWLGGQARKLGAGLKRLARRTAARPQVAWHQWRLGRALEKIHPTAYEKLAQVKADATLDPTLKLQFLKAVRTRMRPGVDPRALMTNVVAENSDRFCLQGRALTNREIASAAPLTKLLSLADVFDKHMLIEDYEKRFASYDDWRAALARDPKLFDPKLHLKPDAEVGRWWSPLEDTKEPTLEHAVEARQLSRDYSGGAIRAHLPVEEAAKTQFHKPTAFDAMFFDPWQPPPAKGKWGYIKTQDGKVVIREAVTQPVKVSSCSVFETMLPSTPETTTSSTDQLVKAMETLP